MEIRGRNKINPNFNMSSMTDIVFLLLIFFMLTSTLVTVNALDIIFTHADRWERYWSGLEKEIMQLAAELAIDMRAFFHPYEAFFNNVRY